MGPRDGGKAEEVKKGMLSVQVPGVNCIEITKGAHF